MSITAHRDVIKSIVQARLPAMSHLPIPEQRQVVANLFSQELAERKRHLTYSARQELARLSDLTTQKPFDEVWFSPKIGP